MENSVEKTSPVLCFLLDRIWFLSLFDSFPSLKQDSVDSTLNALESQMSEQWGVIRSLSGAPGMAKTGDSAQGKGGSEMFPLCSWVQEIQKTGGDGQRGMAAWQVSICSKRESQLNTAMISSWDVSYPCCWNPAAFWFFGRPREGTVMMEYKHRHFMLRFSSENPFQVFFLLVWDEIGLQHFPLVKLSHLCKCPGIYHLKFKSYSMH